MIEIIQKICNYKIGEIIKKIYKSENNRNINIAYTYFKFVGFSSTID